MKAENPRTALHILAQRNIKIPSGEIAMVELRRSSIALRMPGKESDEHIRAKTVRQIPNEEFMPIAEKLGIITASPDP